MWWYNVSQSTAHFLINVLVWEFRSLGPMRPRNNSSKEWMRSRFSDDRWQPEQGSKSANYMLCMDQPGWLDRSGRSIPSSTRFSLCLEITPQVVSTSSYWFYDLIIDWARISWIKFISTFIHCFQVKIQVYSGKCFESSNLTLLFLGNHRAQRRKGATAPVRLSS